MNTPKSPVKILLAITVVGTLILLLLAGGVCAFLYHGEQQFIKRSIPVSAEVVRVTPKKDTDGKEVYQRTFAFVLPDSTLVHEANENWAVSWDAPEKLTGQKFDIRVDSTNLKFVKPDDWISLHLFTTVALLISAVIIVPAFLFLIFVSILAFCMRFFRK